MPPVRVVAVAPDSPAARAGVAPGDLLVAVNGDDLRDVIEYRWKADEALVELELAAGGLERTVVVEKREGVPLGLEFDRAVFDRVRTCDNRCAFCFVYQLPQGMRPSLSVKDDDYRLSFLYGNFTTLTRFTDADFERVVRQGLSPLYVSIHSTDPELRARLLRNRRGATSLRRLARLLEAGVEVHGQIVVCPGINDGPALDDTMRGILEQYPRLATAGVVPLGVSAHNREPGLRPHTPDEAGAVLDTVGCWQKRFGAELGRRLVYAADELYLLAGRRFPPLSAYDGCPQHENGIGMAATFAAEVRAALVGRGTPPNGRPSGAGAVLDGVPAEGYRAPRLAPGATEMPETTDTTDAASSAGGGDGVPPVALVTGRLGAAVLAPLLPELARASGTTPRLVTVPNRFFGGNVAVTGLLTGRDLAAALAAEPAGRRYLLPDVVLSQGRFLDDLTPADLPHPVEVVATDGAALVAALRGAGRERSAGRSRAGASR